MSMTILRPVRVAILSLAILAPAQNWAATAPQPPFPPQPGQGAPVAAPPAPAPAAQATGSCASRRMSDWSVLSDSQVLVRQGGGKRYTVTFAGGCPYLRDRNTIKVVNGVSLCLNPGDSVTFSRRTGVGAQVVGACSIASVQPTS